MNKFLERFALVWGCAVLLWNVIAIIGLFVGAGGFLSGLWQVWEIYSPFNVINWVSEVALFSPAFVAIYWLEKRQARMAHTPEQKQQFDMTR